MLNVPLYFETYRSSRAKMFWKIGALKNFMIFTGKHLCWSLFLLKFIQNRLQRRCFPVNFAEVLRIAIFIEHLWWLLECRVITMKQVQVASAAFLRRFFRKIFLNSWSIGRRISTAESDLSRVAPATLLLSLSVMDNFQEILQKFRKIVFNTRNNS